MNMIYQVTLLGLLSSNYICKLSSTYTLESCFESLPNLAIKMFLLQKWWSLVTGSVILECSTFCLKYLVFQDSWHLKAGFTVAYFLICCSMVFNFLAECTLCSLTQIHLHLYIYILISFLFRPFFLLFFVLLLISNIYIIFSLYS